MKTVLYMDDVNLLCTDILSIHRTMDLTDWFGRALAARLNRKKSQIQFFGPWESIETRKIEPEVKKTDIKILGIKIDQDRGGKEIGKIL